MDVGRYFSFLFKFSVIKNGEPDQMPYFAVSDMVLHCLLMSHKKDARLIWVQFQQDNSTLSHDIASWSDIMPSSK